MLSKHRFSVIFYEWFLYVRSVVSLRWIQGLINACHRRLEKLEEQLNKTLHQQSVMNFACQ